MNRIFFKIAIPYITKNHFSPTQYLLFMTGTNMNILFTGKRFQSVSILQILTSENIWICLCLDNKSKYLLCFFLSIDDLLKTTLFFFFTLVYVCMRVCMHMYLFMWACAWVYPYVVTCVSRCGGQRSMLDIFLCLLPHDFWNRFLTESRTHRLATVAGHLSSKCLPGHFHHSWGYRWHHFYQSLHTAMASTSPTESSPQPPLLIVF